MVCVSEVHGDSWIAFGGILALTGGGAVQQKEISPTIKLPLIPLLFSPAGGVEKEPNKLDIRSNATSEIDFFIGC